MEKKRKKKLKLAKRPGSEKRHKTAALVIHRDEPVEPEHIPAGSVFKCYRDWVVQDLKLSPCNIRYRLKLSPSGRTLKTIHRRDAETQRRRESISLRLCVSAVKNGNSYTIKVYETADGGYVTGKLPTNLEDRHYGPELIRFILYQYYHCHVTQPLLLEQLREIGVDISSV